MKRFAIATVLCLIASTARSQPNGPPPIGPSSFKAGTGLSVSSVTSPPSVTYSFTGSSGGLSSITGTNGITITSGSIAGLSNIASGGPDVLGISGTSGYPVPLSMAVLSGTGMLNLGQYVPYSGANQGVNLGNQTLADSGAVSLYKTLSVSASIAGPLVTFNQMGGSIGGLGLQINASTAPAALDVYGPTHLDSGSIVTNGSGAMTATSFIGPLTGNASTATALATGRTISITGDLSYTSPTFDGTSNVTAAGTIGAGAVTLSKMANLTTNSVIGNSTGSPATPTAISIATLSGSGMLNISGSLAGYVPYSGATGDVNLNGHHIVASEFDALTSGGTLNLSGGTGYTRIQQSFNTCILFPALDTTTAFSFQNAGVNKSGFSIDTLNSCVVLPQISAGLLLSTNSTNAIVGTSLGSGLSLTGSVLNTAGTYLTSVSANTPITGNGTSGNPLLMAAATGSVNGYLTSGNWTTFNGKADYSFGSNNFSGSNGSFTTTGGSIGVGTASPADLVEVSGSTNNPNIRVTISTTASGNYYGGLNFGNASSISTGNYTGNVGQFAITASNYATSGEFLPSSLYFQYFGTNRMAFINRASAPIEFLINGTTSSARAMYLDTNTNIYAGVNGGNIGFNTISPGAKLHVVTGGTAGIGEIIQGAISQSSDLQQWQNNSGTVLLSVGSGGVAASSFIVTDTASRLAAYSEPAITLLGNSGTASATPLALSTTAVNTMLGTITSLSASSPFSVSGNTVSLSASGIRTFLGQSTFSLTGQTAANTSVAVITSPNDGAKHIYTIGAYVTVTAINTATIGAQVAYTDDNGTSETQTFYTMAATPVAGLTATGQSNFAATVISVNPNTTITIKSTLTGVSGTYNVGGYFHQEN